MCGTHNGGCGSCTFFLKPSQKCIFYLCKKTEKLVLKVQFSGFRSPRGFHINWKIQEKSSFKKDGTSRTEVRSIMESMKRMKMKCMWQCYNFMQIHSSGNKPDYNVEGKLWEPSFVKETFIPNIENLSKQTCFLLHCHTACNHQDKWDSAQTHCDFWDGKAGTGLLSFQSVVDHSTSASQLTQCSLAEKVIIKWTVQKIFKENILKLIFGISPGMHLKGVKKH